MLSLSTVVQSEAHQGKETISLGAHRYIKTKLKFTPSSAKLTKATVKRPEVVEFKSH